MCARVSDQIPYKQAPEKRLTDALYRKLGISLNPQALRIFIRTHWVLVRDAAHEIHDCRFSTRLRDRK